MITLGIIGVVAAMTLPVLIQNKQDKELIVKTKKVWSDINNAFLLSQQSYGVVGDNSLLFNASDNASVVAKNLAKYFNGAKVCNSYTDCQEYKYDVKYSTKRLNEDNTAKTERLAYDKIILSNGAVISVGTNRNGCELTEYTSTKVDSNGQVLKDENGNPITSTYYSTTCGNLQFDVNGLQGPNQYGRDVYYFWVKRDKLEPCFYDYYGGVSLRNILSGKDKLEYLNYKKGQTFD